MSLLNKMFGSKKPQATPTEAQENVRNTMEMLNKKSAHLESQIKVQVDIARKNAKTDKRMALNALKKKKLYEKRLTEIDGTITMLDNQLATLDGAQMNVETLKTMKTVNDALKQTHKDMNIEDIYKMKDQMEEQRELSNEISGIISQPEGLDLVDDDELLRELEDLEGEQDDLALEELLNVDVPASDLPKRQVPSTSQPAASQKSKKQLEEEEQLAKLASWSS